MRISEIIKTQGRSLSFEFFPPLTPIGEDRLLERIAMLKAYDPSFISVTQHVGQNTLQRTRHMVNMMHKNTGLTIVPHITCADPRRSELSSIIEDYKKLGIENILALRGDPEEYGADILDGVAHYCYAADLVKFIAGFNMFCIGVGVYPEGHPQSSNLGIDVSNTKKKIDQGADFAISQMFFDNFYFYDMLDRFIQDGINIPVIAGIMPITDFQIVEQLAEQGGVEIPVTLTTQFEELDDPDDVLQAGIDFATEQCLDLWENGIRSFHFYTLNSDKAVYKILDNLSPTISQPL
ncbi:MAG: methylenetetrahydrofolate reductase [Dehalococcoidia bacterium]|nr:methylenetetrahydrofolate reductase [Dehalococcoidia bacterium]